MPAVTAFPSAAAPARPEGADVPPVWLASVGAEDRRSGARVFNGPAGALVVTGDASGAMPVAGGRHDVACVVEGGLYDRALLAGGLDLDADSFNDAELIAAAWERWGADAFARMRGRLSCVVWDGRTGVVCAVRDRVGSVPLYFALSGGVLHVSPDVERLVAQPGVGADLNRAGIADHLCHRWPSVDETHYAAVRRVPSAHYLRWEQGRQRYERYWSPVPPGGVVRWVKDDEVEQFEVLLDQAVTRCLEAGPSSIFLSGGFDSVSIAAMAVDRAKHLGHRPPLALSLAFPHPECNEEGMQRGVAAQLGLSQVLLPFQDAAGPTGIVQAALAINAATPLPMMNPWRPAYRRLGEAGAERGCRVAINGGGGDEFLTVGPAYMADMFRTMNLVGLAKYAGNTLRSFSLNRPLLLRNLLWKHGLRSLAAARATQALKAVAPDVLRRRWRAKLKAAAPAWLAPDPALQRELDERVDRLVEELLTREAPSGPFGFYFRGLPDAFLHPMRSLDQEELYSSRRRVGLRELQPYWDSDLVDFLFRTPPRLLNRGGRTKGLVRYAVDRRFPGLGFERHRKISASSFFCEQVQEQAPAAWQRLGGIRTLASLGIVEDRRVNAWLSARVPDERRVETARVWETLSLEAWVRAHVR